jgi:hypothetical protein
MNLGRLGLQELLRILIVRLHCLFSFDFDFSGFCPLTGTGANDCANRSRGVQETATRVRGIFWVVGRRVLDLRQ